MEKKKRHSVLKRAMAVALSLMLAFTGLQLSGLRADAAGAEGVETASKTQTEPETTETVSMAQLETETTETASRIEAASDKPETVDRVFDESSTIAGAFDKSETVDGVSIRVKADPGVLPEGAALSVRKVYFDEKQSVEAAVGSAREDGKNIAKSLTYDIKVLDENGKEIEPDTSKGSVRVSFTMAEAGNQNLSADIYHIGDDMNAKKLDSSKTTNGGSSAVFAETDGFSYYTVEFTYDQKQYVMNGDTEVPLQDILDYVGIAGKVTNVSTSNSELFSAEQRDGVWYISANKAFKTQEWLKVTLDGVGMEVEIVVTDANTYTATGAEGKILYAGDVIKPDGGDRNDLQIWYRESKDGISKKVVKLYDGANHTIETIDGIDTWYAYDTVVHEGSETYDGKTTNFKGHQVHLSPRRIKVNFEKYGAEGGDDSVIVKYNEPMPQITPPLSRYSYKSSGNKFRGYYYNNVLYYNADGTSAHNWDYEEYKEFELKADFGEVEINLYNDWWVDEYGERHFSSIKYFTWEDGELLPEFNGQRTGGNMQVYFPTVPTKDGYKFLGYYTAIEGGKQIYDAQGKTSTVCNTSNFEYIHPGNNLFVRRAKLYARWSPPADPPTLTAYNGTYDGAEHTVSAVPGSGGTLKYSTDQENWSTSAPKYSQAGTYTIYAKTEGDATHADSEIVSSTVTINPKPIGLEWSNTSLTYNGSPQKPTATATELIGNDKCSVTVTGEKTNVGTYTATATSVDNPNYKIPSANTTQYTINPCETTITISAADMIYTGSAREPVPKVTADSNNNAVIPASEYTYTYENNINAGTATITVTDNNENGNYIIIENSKDFTVISKNLDNTDAKNGITEVTFDDIPAQIYSGQAYTPDVTIKYNGAILKEGSDFDVEYDDNVNAGTAKVILTGKGNYQGTVTRNFTINPLPLTTAAENFSLTLSGSEFTYDGTPKVPAETLVRGGVSGFENIGLIQGQDYEVSFSNDNTAVRAESGFSTADKNAVDAGTITLRVAGKGNYSGYLDITYKILPMEVEVYGLVAKDREYDGTKVVTIDPSKATLHGIVGDDKISVESSTTGEMEDAKVGAGKKVNLKTVKISGKHASDYVLTSVDPVLVNITKRELKPEMFSFKTAVPVTYNSAEQKPDIALNDKNNGKDILALSDVKFTYTNNVHAGTATVTIDAKDDGNYTGKVEMTFVINPEPVTIKARDADSVYGQDIADVTELYEVTAGTIYEADKANMAVKAVTSVKKGYAKGEYENANSITYNTQNKDYDVTIQKGNYTILNSPLFTLGDEVGRFLF